ncbi:DUF3854 domain-containing protein [Nocardioides caricicola]|uniref:DUF3854 domain-containing protein n=1 Tax=Nocardioides caricicola TaxID=634770 RepID=A0ABW0N5I2_9ACTN
MSKKPLSGRHLRQLTQESGISREVIEQRGYRTVRSLDELRELGFRPRASWRRSDKGLLIPLHLPASAPASDVPPVIYRPDVPITYSSRSGKREVMKYAHPDGARNYIDVHPSMREALQDSSVDVLITEGHKKADAATSRGLVCLGLSGVWNFVYRSRDENGRRADSELCDEWDAIPTDGRAFTIVYDSDLVSKPGVQDARWRLTRFLRERGARVFWVDLPAGQNGAKQGLDDYFVAGHTPNDLRALVQAAPTRGPRQQGRLAS